jgi:hypothetical protein
MSILRFVFVNTLTCFSGHRRSSMSDDDHMSDRDMGAPSPGGMSSLGGGSRPGSPLGGGSVRDLDDLPTTSLDDTPLMNSTRAMRSSRMATAAAMSAAALADQDDDQVCSPNSIKF